MKEKAQPTAATEKTCKKCGETKPLSQFYRSVLTKDGYRNECAACSRIVVRKANEARSRNARKRREAEAARKTTTLVLDFSAFPEMLTEIRRIAEADMRTPETQVLWWLKRHVGHPQRAAVLSQSEVNT